MIYDKYKALEPMKYFDKDEDDLSKTLQQKRRDIINNKDNLYVASIKHDGEWAMFIKGEDGQILIRSRSRGVNGSFGDFTQKVPHLVEEMSKWPNGSVVLGELCWPVEGSTSKDVGKILRCLPQKAIERQKDIKLIVYVFDLLAWNGEDYAATAYIKRLCCAQSVINNYTYFNKTEVIFDNFASVADEVINAGGEGIVIQRKDNAYLSGTRTAWMSLKLKQKLPVMELQVCGIVEPNKEYNGIERDTWQYWENGIAVTKPYYFGRKVGVQVKYNNTIVNVTSGCSEENGEWLASGEAQALIAQGKVWAQIKAMMETTNEKGSSSLRHPVLVDVRILDEKGE